MIRYTNIQHYYEEAFLQHYAKKHGCYMGRISFFVKGEDWVLLRDDSKFYPTKCLGSTGMAVAALNIQFLQPDIDDSKKKNIRYLERHTRGAHANNLTINWNQKVFS